MEIDTEIKLVIFDVDGVLTDGSLYYGTDGEALKAFNVKDGFAFSLLSYYGIKTAFISGKNSLPLAKRASDLNIDFFESGISDKLSKYNEIKTDTGIDDSEVCFVGDDINDLPLLEIVGLSIAPFDAHPLVKETVNYVSSCKGGGGVARDIAEYILLSSNLTLQEIYAPFLSSFLGNNSPTQ